MTPSLTFYRAPMSTSTVTEQVLAVLGTPHEIITLNISEGETRKPNFLAINPNGRVPTIVHDGTAIWESAAITLYLGETFGVDKGLYPKAGPKRGEAMKWVVWANVSLADAGGRLAAAAPKGTPGGVQEGSVDEDATISESVAAIMAQKAREDISKLLAVLNGALEGREYLLGDYSIVDVHLNSFVGWLGMMGMSLEQFPKVAEWALRVENKANGQ